MGVTHSVDGGVGTFCHELMLQTVTVAVAANDATDFPELYIVEELMTGDSYLAHEQLVDVVGGYEFFLRPPFVFFSFGSPVGIS